MNFMSTPMSALLRSSFCLVACLSLHSCDFQKKPNPPSPVSSTGSSIEACKHSVVRINSTIQSWNAGQPWEKNQPQERKALAAVVAPQLVLTTAEIVADATFIELESTDGTRRCPAQVKVVDYEANLALVGVGDAEPGKSFFADLKPLNLAAAPGINAVLDMVQIEESGHCIVTPATLQSVDVRSTFLEGQMFLTYLLKASLQSAKSSYTLPVLKNGELVGVLTSYDNKEQVSEVISTPLLQRFISDAQKENYQGFPNLGIAASNTEDALFRQWLKLPEESGGLYVSKVRKGSAADSAKLQQGDVILAIDGHAIDRRGYYQDAQYGSLFWVQLVRGTKSVGDALDLSVLRQGSPLNLRATLTRQDESTRLVPQYTFGTAPPFLVKGGLILQELSRPLLEAYGEEWHSRAPLNFLDALNDPESYQDRYDRIVCLTAIIPTPATVGYETLRNLIVKRINGKDIRNMDDAIKAFAQPTLGQSFHTVEFDDENLTLYLDPNLSDQVDRNLRSRGLTRLSRGRAQGANAQ